LGHVHSDKKAENNIKRERSYTLEELKHKREMEKNKRASFSDLMMDSPSVPVPQSGKRMSFTDIADGTKKNVSIDFDAGFFNDETEPKNDDVTSDASSSSSSSSSSEEEDDDDTQDKNTKKVVVLKVKVPRNARVGQVVNVRHYDRMFTVKIPHAAIGKKSFKVKIEIDTSKPDEGKNFITGHGLLRQSRVVYKMWKHVYFCCTPTSLTVYESEEDYRKNTGIVDTIKLHTLCEIGKLYAKEDRASKRQVWQMKIMENELNSSNQAAIRDHKLWKMDPRVPITERVKIGAVEGHHGKKLLMDIRAMLQQRLKKLQQVALAKSCVRNM